MDWFDEFCEEYGIPESKLKPLKDKTLEEVIEEGETEHDRKPSKDEYVFYNTVVMSVKVTDVVVNAIERIVGKHKNVRSRNKVIAFATKLGVTFDSAYRVKPYGRLRNYVFDMIGNVRDKDIFEMANREFSQLDRLTEYREKGASVKINVRPFWWVTAYISDFAPRYNVHNTSLVVKLLLYYGLSRSEKYLPAMYRAIMIDKVREMVGVINGAYAKSFDICKKVCRLVAYSDKDLVKDFINKVKKIDSELYDELVKYLAMLDV